MRAFFIFIALIFIASGPLAGPSFAINQKDISDCDQDESDDLRITGCTRLINAREVSTRSIASAYNKRGIAWKQKGEFDKALADYAQAIRIDPKQRYPWHNRAHLWLSREQYDKAIADFNQAIKLDPAQAAGPTPTTARRITIAPSPTTAKPSASIPKSRLSTMPAAMFTKPRTITIAPLPITTQRSASIPNISMHCAIASSP